ncbi:acyl transferase/acyl hydrolase/lysophospholipase [Alternaria rosae]|uniref:acyl transferase/acyl hydrolase/lysophospholipase n=1 Tax=Alternaria rosae TaxID=1187941 RepID=UPI001E8EE122|nr:acyl transferase/acyl hydrolase/lysophospholipase [Alternaria rosae]KAH6879001.1 acyl transferase/acyl hydrolase/lysophospholipase [Alternaria rosae]
MTSVGGANVTGASAPDPVKLLVIDGGGVRGLSALVILEQLMDASNEYRRDQGLEALEPWQAFDMIGGTSTGGLIAVMLGRLRLSIEECKNAYTNLARNAFTPKNWASSTAAKVTLGPKFKTAPLEEAIKSLIGDNANSELLKENDPVCKVFVVAHNHKISEPVVLRSYRNRRKPKASFEVMRIWEACRATSAALTFFEPIVVGDLKYSDGGLHYNNPVEILHGEAGEVFPGREQFIVSLGTGIGTPKEFHPTLASIAQTLADLNTQTERTADNFYRREDSKAAKAGRYYRFNVPGMGDIGLEEADELLNIRVLTEKYLEASELGEKADACAKQIAAGAYHVSETVHSLPHSLDGEYEPTQLGFRERLDALRAPT